MADTDDRTPQQIAADNAAAKTSRIISAIVASVLLTGLIITEIILSFRSEVTSTTDRDFGFSHIVRAWSIVGLAAPFGWGVLAGHFFHPIANLNSIFRWTPEMREKISTTSNLLLAVSLIVLLAIIDVIVALATDDWVYWQGMSPIMLFLGFVWGTLAWPVTVSEEIEYEEERSQPDRNP